MDAITSGLIALDRFPVEVLPGYWVMSGVIPYEGQVAVAALEAGEGEGSQGDSVDDCPTRTGFVAEIPAQSGKSIPLRDANPDLESRE